ncbi:MAG TPA: Glu/Leu/Phe/Val dehydrogenase dimerization domain-containing protein [Pyrinomonadaceae bacterium]|nr:Glu/Leu/Phe/Val dehydrogenase dimerization domain-containing protein [Pyrinomonadaceae bacterium]
MTFSSTRNLCEIYTETEHEKIVLWSDPASDYRGIIAIHSTALGPAVGGTRFCHYATDEEASHDALRLARAMSFKNALAGLPFGGGKAVIIGDNGAINREKIFRAHGRFVETLAGRFITAEDVGTSPSDMEYVRAETRYVAGLPGGSGDPSPMTARGVLRAMQASAQHRWGSGDISGRTVAVLGCGKTGYSLARELKEAGAKLLVADLAAERVKRVVDEFGAREVSPTEIFGARADIFAPCSLGGILNDETLPQLKAEIVAGCANNQLLEESHGDALHEAGILFAPDYVSNAGGVINGCRELLGWNSAETLARVDAIYDHMLTLFALAGTAGVAPFRMAEKMAREILYPEPSTHPIKNMVGTVGVVQGLP